MALEVTRHGGQEPPMPAFYFDFNNPDAYLAAERVIGTLPFAAEWTPVRSPRPWAGDDDARRAVERTAAERTLQAVRWPPAFDSELALRAATFAKSIGRSVAFGLAAFRQAYAGGHDLGDPDVVLIAASACEMHPRAVLQALERAAVKVQLDEATALAVARGVPDVPCVWRPDGPLLVGDASLDLAG